MPRRGISNAPICFAYERPQRMRSRRTESVGRLGKVTASISSDGLKFERPARSRRRGLCRAR